MPITRIELFVTEDCTLCCDYCFVREKRAGLRMPWDIAKRAVDFLMEYSGSQRHLEVVFFGGEPLLEFPLIRRIAAYTEERAAALGKIVSYSLTTNGTVMTEEILAFARSRGFNYLLSIDGGPESHNRHRVRSDGSGSWDAVTGPNFRLLKSRQRWVGARATVSPDTAASLAANVRLLAGMGVNQFIIGINSDVKWTQPELNLFLSEREKVADYYLRARAAGASLRIAAFDGTVAAQRARLAGAWACDAGRNRVAVSTTGDIYPCSRFVRPGPTTEGRYRLGHVLTGVEDLRARTELADNRDDRRPRCSACEHRAVCAGGCPALNLLWNGSIFEPSPYDCTLTRAHVDLLSRIEQARKTGGGPSAGDESGPHDRRMA
jgi:uncharacterized protein